MKVDQDLRNILSRIDGRGYKAYKDIEGEYQFKSFTLIIDHAQGDPFASPSRVRVRIPTNTAGFPPDTYENKSREIATRDFIARSFYLLSRRFARGNRGTGNSGLISISRPGQEILERSSVIINEKFVEVRFFIGLPAAGRKVLSREAEVMFFREIPEIVKHSLFFTNLNRENLYKHINVSEDADLIRKKLRELKLVCFIANGAILPRESGISQKPLDPSKAIKFKSPQSLEVQIQTKHHGIVKGMGIPSGVTLITGGGYHGKSTLLNAIELGVYNHVPGDGREFVITDDTAMKIRAEDGRSIKNVDISPFINHLPFNLDTTLFSTEDASGSTSQAANIIEALEAGSKLLLIDEDTSATNFMIRDFRMQKLVEKEKEPITPFIDKVKPLYKDYGVSSIIVIGGSGDYLDVADCVICMIEYLPHDYTEKAKEIARTFPTDRIFEGDTNFGKINDRIILRESFNELFSRDKIKLKARGLYHIQAGRENIDLSCVEQLIDEGQTKAISSSLLYIRNLIDNTHTLKEIIDKVQRDISTRGLNVIGSKYSGEYVYFRPLELAATLNRLRNLKVKMR